MYKNYCKGCPQCYKCCELHHIAAKKKDLFCSIARATLSRPFYKSTSAAECSLEITNWM